MQEFLEWFHESLRNFWKTIGGLAAVFLLGFFLTFVLPPMAKHSAVVLAQNAISIADQDNTKASLEYTSQEQWFAPSYVTSVPGLFKSAQEEIASAEVALANAQSNWSVDQSVDFATQAKQKAQNSSSTIVKVWEIFNGNRDVRQQAMTQLEARKADFVSTAVTLESANTRYTKEHDPYLKKYTDSMESSLSTAEDKKTVGANFITVATAVMPPLSDTTRSGDPNTALQNLDAAKTLIDEINTLAGQVTAGLDYQREVAQNVSTTITSADSHISAADNHMSNVSATRGYTKDKALKDADNLYRQAVGLRDQAKKIMVSPITAEGGRVDAPAAYEAAKQAVTDADQSVAEVDKQVAYEDSARNKLSSYQSLLTTANNAVSQAQYDKRTLESNHAFDTWSSVSGNIETAQSNVRVAEVHKNNALAALDNSQQRYADADTEAQRSLDVLNDTTVLGQAVTSRAIYLEGYRSDWPSARSNAQNTIDGERSQVQSYGSYDSGAQSDFNTAVNLLNQAEGEASSLYYEPAVNDAHQATSLASGTGGRSYAAYEAEQARQRAEEEARQRAEEESQRQAQLQSQSYSNSDSGSSGSFDSGGGSSCCDSGGDGGDFGGGSTGGDGGDW